MGSTFVDVAIGLTLMYLVLSLVCTTLNELIATALKWRAKSLSQAITQLIDHDQLRAAFYNNGLIANTKVASRGGAPTPPAPPAAAAPQPADVNAAAGPDGQPVKPPETVAGGRPKDREHPSYFDGRTFAMALLDSLTSTPAAREAQVVATKFPSIDDIQKTVEKLPDSNIRDVLLANLASGKKDVADLRDSLAAWFDSTMDRLSGDYKRWLKALSLAVGIVVAIVFNADTVWVSRALWQDPALRGAIVADANNIAGKPLPNQCTDPDPQKQTACLIGQLKSQQETMRPFPVGWPDAGFMADYHDARDAGAAAWVIFMKIIGLLWTGIALSLGAPFWFDLLQNFVNIRGAGPKPPRSDS